MSPRGRSLVHGHDLIAFHSRLQCTDRIDLGHHNAGTLATQACSGTLADIAESGNHSNLARHHHVGRALDAVDQAFAAAVKVVKLRLGHAVVHVERRHLQAAHLRHLVQAVHAGGRLLRQALHVLQHVGIFLVHQLRQVAAVVQNHVGRPAIRPLDRLLDAPPELVLFHALPRENGDACRRDGGGCLVLRGKDVARRPADRRTQVDQRLDQHGSLDGHVQAARDARALQWRFARILRTQGHQARHLGLGDGNFLAAPAREGGILDLAVGKAVVGVSGCHETLQSRPAGAVSDTGYIIPCHAARMPARPQPRFRRRGCGGS